MIQTAIYIRANTGVPLGFQEVVYINSTDPIATNALFYTGGSTGNLQKRAAFLTKNCEIYAVRSSVVGGPRQSDLYRFVPPIQGAQGAADDIDTALAYFAYSATKQTKRQFHFRGLSSNWFTQMDKLNPTGIGSLSLIDNWMTFLKTNGLVIKRPTVNSTVQISGTSRDATSGNIVVNFTPAFQPAGNQLVTIIGAKQYPYLRGNWLTPASSIPLTSCILLGTFRLNPPSAMTATMRFIDPAPNWVTVNSWELNDVSDKKTGRPSFLRRGRRSKQIFHR